MSLLSVSRDVGEFRKRYKWMALAVLIVFGLLLSRLFYMQVIEHERYAAIARENIIKTVSLPATRGIIRDMHGQVIADNRPSYRLFVTPTRLRTAADVDQIVYLLGLRPEEAEAFRKRLRDIPGARRSHQVELLGELTDAQLAAMETHARELPAVDVVVAPVRTYPFAALAAHAIGYLNEVSGDELAANSDLGYRAGDRVGRTGIERAWESILRGQRGYKRVFVDARGRRSRVTPPDTAGLELGREPVPGRDLTLTLDMELMRSVERTFRGHPSGSVVVVDVRTGEVRALFSKPAYDLNELSTGLSITRSTELNENPFRPLIDKTIYDSYFPGSTFKPVSALAALVDGVMDPSQTIECPGYYELGKRRFRCTDAHGDVDMSRALTASCNVYFYKLAEVVGMDRLARYAKELGLGVKTGIGINTETAGFIPTRDWYEKRGEPFRIGYTLNTAIGQGNTRVTLMQLAMAYVALANGGTLFVPQLVESVKAPDGTVLEKFGPRVRKKLPFDPAHFALLRQALWGVVNDPNGTAYETRIEGGVEVSGKTGTAQVARGNKAIEDPKQSWYYNRDHAWFAGWAPSSAPEVVIVVLVEHGGGGGKHAAPIAVRIMQDYLGDRTLGATQLTQGVP